MTQSLRDFERDNRLERWERLNRPLYLANWSEHPRQRRPIGAMQAAAAAFLFGSVALIFFALMWVVLAIGRALSGA